eukprot:EG_transcript_27501
MPSRWLQIFIFKCAIRYWHIPCTPLSPLTFGPSRCPSNSYIFSNPYFEAEVIRPPLRRGPCLGRASGHRPSSLPSSSRAGHGATIPPRARLPCIVSWASFGWPVPLLPQPHRQLARMDLYFNPQLIRLHFDTPLLNKCTVYYQGVKHQHIPTFRLCASTSSPSYFFFALLRLVAFTGTAKQTVYELS